MMASLRCWLPEPLGLLWPHRARWLLISVLAATQSGLAIVQAKCLGLALASVWTPQPGRLGLIITVFVVSAILASVADVAVTMLAQQMRLAILLRLQASILTAPSPAGIMPQEILLRWDRDAGDVAQHVMVLSLRAAQQGTQLVVLGLACLWWSWPLTLAVGAVIALLPWATIRLVRRLWPLMDDIHSARSDAMTHALAVFRGDADPHVGLLHRWRAAHWRYLRIEKQGSCARSALHALVTGATLGLVAWRVSTHHADLIGLASWLYLIRQALPQVQQASSLGVAWYQLRQVWPRVQAVGGRA